jgi:hypothetical protein
MTGDLTGFIRVIEVWRPQDETLRFAGGVYGTHAEFASLSARTRFRPGEGLPGAVWSSGRAQIWDELGSAFVRSRAAREAGLDAALAFPVFRAGECSAVVCLLCGSQEQAGGCMEIWEPNPLRELAHAGGYYGTLSAFAHVSRLMRFPLGRGLPGIVWERGAPHIIEDTRASNSFLRASAARDSGVEAGLGIPLHRDGALSQVLVLLSAQTTPLARAFEVWLPDAQQRFRLAESFYGRGFSASAAPDARSVAAGAGVLGRALLTGLPYAFSTADADSPFPGRERALAAGVRGGIAIPLDVDGTVRALVMLLI